MQETIILLFMLHRYEILQVTRREESAGEISGPKRNEAIVGWTIKMQETIILPFHVAQI